VLLVVDGMMVGRIGNVKVSIHFLL
jgi:hypothetical protein